MIHQESFTENWIEQILAEKKSSNYGLAEKMIYAFCLLEHLARCELPFIFKGGTALALLMPELHRFSKDIDILMEERPENLEQIFDDIIHVGPFIRWEHSPREPEFDVPKEHFKFYYKLSRPGKFEEEPILLDILYGDSSYPAVRRVAIRHRLLKTDEPFTEVTLPTVEGITGDKLTAFAPQTLGIPFGKNKSVEIVKQLFDVHELMNHSEDWTTVSSAFRKTVTIVAGYYNKVVTPDDVIDDVVQTAFILGMRGKVHRPEFQEMKQGIDGLNNYLFDQRFSLPDAITASSRVARMALAIKAEVEYVPVNWREAGTEKLRHRNLTHPKYKSLNKPLKKGYPDAWYEWVHIEELLDR